MKRVKAIGAVAAFILICCAYAGMAQSNQGKEFWTGYMSHMENTGSSRMSLYITGGVNTTGRVEMADGSYTQDFKVIANEVTTVSVPRSAFLKNQGKYFKGVHITAGRNIAVYAHIYANSVSGATLLLPVNALGKSYYSINYAQYSNSDTDKAHSYSTAMVVAVEDNTVVEIIPTGKLEDGSPAGTPITVTMEKGEVYQILSQTDLSNTVIRTVSTGNGECKRIAVFSGSTKMGIGCPEGGFSSDNLFQQVYPTSSWGKTYVTIPLKNRSFDIIKIVCSSDATTVNVNGTSSFFANRGTFEQQFASNTPNIITADKPIQVVQYAVSQGQDFYRDCEPDLEDVGDPEMIYLTPTEQTLDNVTLYSSPYYSISNHYINVVIKDADQSSFTLDGRPYKDFTPVPGNSGFAYAQIEVADGTHNLKATGGFNAIAYGFGNAESYGYAAGASLKNLNQYIALQDNSTAISSDKVSGCRDVEYKLLLTLPYTTTNISWNFKDGTAPFINNNPVVAYTTVKDGKILYNYAYERLVKFIPGDYSITASVTNPNGDQCGTITDIDFDFNIADYPVPKFTFDGVCPGDTTYFHDLSDAKGGELKTWLWEFGDGQTSTLQSPKHLYNRPGEYEVRLTVSNINDCSGTSQVIKVNISKPPVALFNISNPMCAGKEVTVTDVSAPGDGVIIKWLYDFGDGTTETRADNAPFTHLYSNTGTFTIKLTVVTDKDCSSITTEKVIVISPLPVVDFTLPDVCISDVARFTNNSTIADNSESGFTYLWDFGDSNANAVNPNTSTAKDARHRYLRAAVYTVTLTVTSATGCSFSKSQQFTVNGAQPLASFTVENKDALCSSSPVIFRESSTLDFGSFTKIVWYYDYNGNRADTETFTRADLPANRTYNHSFGLFNSPASKTYRVRMEAYSGETCVDTVEHDIVIKANPMVELLKIGTLCLEETPIQMEVNTNGFAGSGVFSGKGVSAAGLFDPAVSGPGVFTVNYAFTSQNGCNFTTAQEITVQPTPAVDAGENTGLLEGGTVLLNASASGKNLTYKWIPATGLDHDNVLNPVCSAIDNVTYKLTVTSSDGCKASDEIYVKVLKKLSVINTFTPNGDGVNDTWNIKYLETYPGNTVDVYNRYGEKVYSSVGYGVPWDGTYKGTNLPSGAYYYIINPKNGRKVVSGSVTIIR